jgi:N-acetylmuramic acid 6-phosphate etherase
MPTEHISPRYVDLDSWSSAEMIEAMYEGQLAAAAAVRGALKAIAAAVDDAVPALRRGGRLVYAGAGTSGRIGVQDGSELPPTFDWPPDRLVFAMAGGLGALVKSVAGAEDDEAEGARTAAEARIGANDVVIGIAASGTTPFTIGVLRAASAAGAVTVAIANNPEAPLFLVARHRIAAETGTEVIAGSTRMKAGTAQKIVVNLFSTSIMVKLGRVYRGLMVDMRARNTKLRRRAESIVSRIVECSQADAERLVNRSEGDVKIAILLGFGLAAAEAAEVLSRQGGNLRLAINDMNKRMVRPAGRRRRKPPTRAAPPKPAGSGKRRQSRPASR